MKLIDLLLEKKVEFPEKDVDLVRKYTHQNQHQSARSHIAYYGWSKYGNRNLKKFDEFYRLLNKLGDVLGGFGPELSKLKQKMEKPFYKEIKKTFSNAEDIIRNL
ncbi:MAG: hypothetical protein CBC24_03085 [Candidatus Pelagibacter sp. TMED64]|nr:hypothetical protein [Candidatus Pelagibacter sp.]OUU66491.1 MAG: hypothetical protein CBC24_03085 [Candidatus Pelagibacter sp. TMED64]